MYRCLRPVTAAASSNGCALMSRRSSSLAAKSSECIHSNEFRIQGAVTLQIVLRPIIQVLDPNEKDRNRIEGGVLLTEQRSNSLAAELGHFGNRVIEILNLTPHHIMGDRPACLLHRYKEMTLPGWIFDLVSELRRLINGWRKKTPSVVQSEERQIRLDQKAQRLCGYAAGRRWREDDGKAVPGDHE